MVTRPAKGALALAGALTREFTDSPTVRALAGVGTRVVEAEIGDEIVVGSNEPGRAGRLATVVGLCTADGIPRYMVHRLAGDHDAMVSPEPGTQIRVLRTTQPHPGARAGHSPVGCRRSASRGQLRARRTGVELRLSFHRGQLLFHARARAGLVELLLDIIGVAADVLEHPGLQ
jgi:Domain of unknown function (DUF1918)